MKIGVKKATAALRKMSVEWVVVPLPMGLYILLSKRCLIE